MKQREFILQEINEKHKLISEPYDTFSNLNAHNDSFYLGLKSWGGLYRFECGMTASVLKINEYFESKQELLNHFDLYYEKIINDLYSILENSKSLMKIFYQKVILVQDQAS